MQRSGRISKRAVFLDRDGVLIKDSPTYIRTVNDVEVLPGVPESLRALRRAGFLTVVVTNQAAVAHGYITEATLRAIHQQMQALLLSADREAILDRIYYCPYHPDARLRRYKRNSGFRKPRPGMLLKAARELGVDLAASYLIGDRQSDVEAALTVGCTPVLVTTGPVSPALPQWSVRPTFVAASIEAASRWILQEFCKEEDRRKVTDAQIR